MNALTCDIRCVAAAAKDAPAPKVARARRTETPFAAPLRAFADWWSARRDAARLSAYPDRMLSDIGVPRGAIEWAVRHGRDEKLTERDAERPIYTDEWSIQNEVHP